MDTRETANAGTGGSDNSPSRDGEAAADTKMQGRKGGGDSGGGAYPNPHSGKEGEGGNEGWMGHGGESDINYFGTGRLGGKDVGENVNAPTEGAKDDD